jgi:GNAT superfamily N-acetyltransferase
MPFAVAESPPAPKKPLTDRALTRHLLGGRELLSDTAKPLRLWRRYADAGKQPTDEQQRAVLGKLVADGREELRHYAEGLESGRLTLERWHRLTRDNIVSRHVAATLATAGTTRVSADERSALLDRINAHLGYLDNFRAELASGDQLLGDGSANRATYYADAVWSTGMNARIDRAKANGVSRARRVLGSADHCNSCIHEASLGWRSIDSILPIGDAECRMLCHCHVEMGGPGTAPPTFGPSKARVTLPEGITPSQAEGYASYLLGRKARLADLASLMGAPDDAIVGLDFDPNNLNVPLSLSAEGPGYEMYRTLSRDDAGRPFLTNDSFQVDKDHRGQGLGARAFGRQVEHAVRLGVDRIEADAASEYGMNGYYTWPRFGYDGEIPREIRTLIEAGQVSPPGDPRRVSDLMKTEEGRAWWKENGTSFRATFDLEDGSLSRRVWDGYLAEKAKTPAGIP